MGCLRHASQKQYNVYLEKWYRFCTRKNLNPLHRDINAVLEFLQHMHHNKYSYSALNTARSALSNVFYEPPIGEHILVNKFLRGVRNIRPNLPRYSRIWDVSTVLKYLEMCAPGKCLNLLQLSQKLVTLIALITGQRCQTIKALDLDDVVFSNAAAKFHIKTLLKHDSTYKRGNNVITLTAYPENKKLCAVTYLKQYINRTKLLRTNNKLFIGSQEPHKPVSSSTISRWIKTTLKDAGINTQLYSAHSTRAAATSAVAKEVDISVIMSAASWSRASTFAKYYKKPIEDKSTAFGLAVLKKK